MVYPPATSETGARRPAIIHLEQFKEASSKPAQLKAFSTQATTICMVCVYCLINHPVM
jgi:hypothetical protein